MKSHAQWFLNNAPPDVIILNSAISFSGKPDKLYNAMCTRINVNGEYSGICFGKGHWFGLETNWWIGGWKAEGYTDWKRFGDETGSLCNQRLGICFLALGNEGKFEVRGYGDVVPGKGKPTNKEAIK
ncbi:MAG: hypothetical protein ABEK59_10545 [Halobacteria archaeon]